MTLDLATLTLDEGGHSGFEAGACLLEAVSYFAGEPWSDHPQCVCTVLGTFGRQLNDVLPNDKRQQLVPLIPKLVGTATDGHTETRSYMALDWLIRTFTPAWLDLAGLSGEAQSLRDLRRIVDLAAAQSAGPVVRESQKKAAAAWVAAGAAAGDAARVAAREAARAAAWVAAGEAAWVAAGVAARDAAREAAWVAAGEAAWAAAGVAAREAARDAAREAARDAAGAAAWDAARDAAGAAAWVAAGAAAWEAAWDKLKPTSDQLQDSAIELFTAMVEVRS